VTRIPIGRAPIKRALISVYDKTGLEELASGLHAAGVEIVSTGSTAARITAAGVPVTPVEELTGFPECLDGRVKTLHPRVHAGLLADMANSQHEAQLAELRVEPFQLLVSNLYPFEATVASGASPEQCVEQIDIGGPSMVRAAAKNHASVAVVIEPSRYADVLAALAEGGFTLDQRRLLAAAAFAHTAAYDIAVASWFASAYAPDETAREAGWPEVAAALWRRADVLRYGENPHQRAALYSRPAPSRAPAGIAAAELLHGKAMSYNNYVDADAARGVRLRRVVRGHHQALQPVRDRRRRRPRRGARQGARLRPGIGVRRGDRGQRPRDRGPGPADQGRVHRGGDRARVRGRGAGHPVREQERPAAPLRPARRRDRGMAAHHRGDAHAVRGPGRPAGR
jgi:AICARFT/IMPCHase bienzyme/MGS-like domain-containing protein